MADETINKKPIDDSDAMSESDDLNISALFVDIVQPEMLSNELNVANKSSTKTGDERVDYSAPTPPPTYTQEEKSIEQRDNIPQEPGALPTATMNCWQPPEHPPILPTSIDKERLEHFAQIEDDFNRLGGDGWDPIIRVPQYHRGIRTVIHSPSTCGSCLSFITHRVDMTKHERDALEYANEAQRAHDKPDLEQARAEGMLAGKQEQASHGNVAMATMRAEFNDELARLGTEKLVIDQQLSRSLSKANGLEIEKKAITDELAQVQATLSLKESEVVDLRNKVSSLKGEIKVLNKNRFPDFKKKPEATGVTPDGSKTSVSDQSSTAVSTHEDTDVGKQDVGMDVDKETTYPVSGNGEEITEEKKENSSCSPDKAPVSSSTDKTLPEFYTDHLGNYWKESEVPSCLWDDRDFTVKDARAQQSRARQKAMESDNNDSKRKRGTESPTGSPPLVLTSEHNAATTVPSSTKKARTENGSVNRPGPQPTSPGPFATPDDLLEFYSHPAVLKPKGCVDAEGQLDKRSLAIVHLLDRVGPAPAARNASKATKDACGKALNGWRKYTFKNAAVPGLLEAKWERFGLNLLKAEGPSIGNLPDTREVTMLTHLRRLLHSDEIKQDLHRWARARRNELEGFTLGYTGDYVELPNLSTISHMQSVGRRMPHLMSYSQAPQPTAPMYAPPPLPPAQYMHQATTAYPVNYNAIGGHNEQSNFGGYNGMQTSGFPYGPQPPFYGNNYQQFTNQYQGMGVSPSFTNQPVQYNYPPQFSDGIIQPPPSNVQGGAEVNKEGSS